MSHWHLGDRDNRNHHTIEISQGKKQHIGRRLMEPWEDGEEEASKDIKEDKRSTRRKAEGCQTIKKEDSIERLMEVTWDKPTQAAWAGPSARVISVEMKSGRWARSERW